VVCGNWALVEPS